MVDHIGEQFGNYRLIRLLGQGGFAEVYLGEHIHLSTQAAIKLLHKRLAPEDVEQFRDEARLLAHFDHPHIVKVLDFGIQNNIPFLIMTYAPNGTLRQKHPKGIAVPFMTVITYINQIAPALQYAHFRKHVHRDIKPQNILIGHDQRLLLSDFGISIAAHDLWVPTFLPPKIPAKDARR
jgi:serine/threonine protein kinase